MPQDGGKRPASLPETLRWATGDRETATSLKQLQKQAENSKNCPAVSDLVAAAAREEYCFLMSCDVRVTSSGSRLNRSLGNFSEEIKNSIQW